MFWEISQNSQENTCARVYFLIKLQAWGQQLYLKSDSSTGVFLWIFAKYLRTPFPQKISGPLLLIWSRACRQILLLITFFRRTSKNLDEAECSYSLKAFSLKMLFFVLIFCRSSRPEVFCKMGVLRNFAKFMGKYLSQSLFFNRVAHGVFLWILRNA